MTSDYPGEMVAEILWAAKRFFFFFVFLRWIETQVEHVHVELESAISKRRMGEAIFKTNEIAYHISGGTRLVRWSEGTP